jgi:hypothetical protein
MKIVLKQIYDDVDVKEPVPGDDASSFIYPTWWNIRNDFLNRDDTYEAIEIARNDLKILQLDDKQIDDVIEKWLDLSHNEEYLAKRNRKHPKPPMLEQIHQKLTAYRLREGFSSKKDFNVSTVVNPVSVPKWDGIAFKKVFDAAKNKDKSALEYIYWKMKGAITSVFWNNYLGPNNTIRGYRINNEDAWEQWLGIAWMSLLGGFKEGTAAGKDDDYVASIKGKAPVEGSKGALESFDFKENLSNEEQWGKLFKLYKRILINSAWHANNSAKGGGMRGNTETVMQYEPTWSGNDDHEGDESELYHDETFHEVETNLSTEKFLDKWGQFTQSAALKTNIKGVTAAQIFFEVIDNPKADFNKMAVDFGISRNSCATLMAKAQDELAKYDLTGQDLIDGIKKFGNAKVASYLKPIKASVVEEKPPAKKEGTFNEKFSQLMSDSKAWDPHIRGCDTANWIYNWIQSGFKDIESVGKENGISKADTKYWHRKAMMLLKKYGITEQDVKNAVKNDGKDEVLDLIGEDNDGTW